MKKILSVFLVMLIVLMPSISNASGMDMIQKALSNDKKGGANILYNIIHKDDKEVKIITDEKGLEEVEGKGEKEIKNTILGIDVSKWNGDIQWDRVAKAGVEFAIIRAGYGQNTIDYQFQKNIKGCIDNDIQVGIYWFSYAYTDEMAVKEAKKCLEVIKPYKKYITMPIFFDFEYDSLAFATRHGVKINRAKCTSITEAFCKEIKNNDYYAGIYTNLDFINNYYIRDILNRYNVWVAEWSYDVDIKPTYKGEYICWQYSDKGKVDGIIGVCDMNIYYPKKKLK